MAERATTALLESPLVAAYDVCCRAPRSGYGPAEAGTVAQLILARRGVFVVHSRGGTYAVDPSTALLLGSGEEYRVSHPGTCGDECTVLIVSPELLEESVGGVEGRFARLRSRDHLAVCFATEAVRRGDADHMEAEEALLLLLARLASAFAGDGLTTDYLGPGQRSRVERVRALLASDPARRWSVSAVAEAVQCSPFHLARQFRALSGETIARHLLHLRLGLAVGRLAAGETNLSSLALATGFASHSHFSTRFRGVFGMTPTAARAALTRGTLEELRELLQPATR
jgi:AraC family transcriptional regulator